MGETSHIVQHGEGLGTNFWQLLQLEFVFSPWRHSVGLQRRALQKFKAVESELTNQLCGESRRVFLCNPSSSTAKLRETWEAGMQAAADMAKFQQDYRPYRKIRTLLDKAKEIY